MKKGVIIALDFERSDQALAFLDQFRGQELWVKVGMELFYSSGPEIITAIKTRGYKIFLDLKLHDIPNTVEKSMAVLAKMDIDMCNLHAVGTKAMMEAALQGLTRKDGKRPLLLAVTQLTSTDQRRMNEELSIQGTMEEVVLKYAKNAAAAGLDGVVCSPLEAPKIHQVCGSNFLTITPGIRLAQAEKSKQHQGTKDDQVRITTPAKAGELGSDYIVVGRPITQAKDPAATYTQCAKEFLGGNI